MQLRKPDSRAILLLGIPLLFAAAWVYPYIPGERVELCAVRHMLGFNCPGCGITRSIIAIVHGNILKSIYLNPMGIVLIVALLYFWIRTFLETVLKRSLPRLISEKAFYFLSVAFIVGLFTQWIIGLITKYFPLP